MSCITDAWSCGVDFPSNKYHTVFKINFKGCDSNKTNAIIEQVNLDIFIDEETKGAAEQICEELGIPLNVAINVFLKQVVIQRVMPFSITLNPTFR